MKIVRKNGKKCHITKASLRNVHCTEILKFGYRIWRNIWCFQDALYLARVSVLLKSFGHRAHVIQNSNSNFVTFACVPDERENVTLYAFRHNFLDPTTSKVSPEMKNRMRLRQEICVTELRVRKRERKKRIVDETGLVHM